MKRVLYGGAFDLLHVGHIRSIERAKKLGYLIINLSSDKQVQNKKGNNRPIIPQEERKEMLQALKFVDEVVCFETDELNLREVIMDTYPDILITNEDNNEYDSICRDYGVDVIKFPRIVPESGLDTTKIITKIRKE
jgi:D-beta-D-heptose 7-phosphate kinase/D-beta-D-heptose 1-phosphate adenosyltransferase